MVISDKIVWTIGHSTRAMDAFLELLTFYRIEQLVDVRRFPGSKRFPHFKKENLESVLPQKGLIYSHLEALGGRRKASVDSENTVWRHPSFRGYADYMETLEFKNTLHALVDMAKKKRCAIMCSEAVWWRCHRSMIADQLKAQGWKVYHIIDGHTPTEHPYTKPAQLKNGQLTYH
ncbi:DUF488 family protein [Mariniflexile ostreae]|uniref:DUF488 family protein n=1 Tax=Mariniflexile ostreae TaxID=1520892 RepID=A0ABV5FFR9_9FLAO